MIEFKSTTGHQLNITDIGRVQSAKYGLVFTNTQFILPGPYVPSNTDIITCTFQQRTPTVNDCVWCARTAMNVSRVLFGAVGSAPRYDYGRSQLSGTRAQIPYNTIVTVKSDANKWYVNDILVATNTANTFTLTYPFILGASVVGSVTSGKDHYFNGTIYDFNVTTAQGEVKINLIAVPTGSTAYSSTPAPSNCFWDTVSQQYYVNGGTGALGLETIQTGDIKWLSKVQRQVGTELKTIWPETIEPGVNFTSTDYLDLCYTPNNTTRLVIDGIFNGTTETVFCIFQTNTDETSNTHFEYYGELDIGSSYYHFGNNPYYIDPMDTIKGLYQQVLLDFNRSAFSINNAIILSADSLMQNFQCSGNLVLGSAYGLGQYKYHGFNGTVYSCKVYDDDVLIRDLVFVSAADTTYGTPPMEDCFYDLVSEQYFYKNLSNACPIAECSTTPVPIITVVPYKPNAATCIPGAIDIISNNSDWAPDGRNTPLAVSNLCNLSSTMITNGYVDFRCQSNTQVTKRVTLTNYPVPISPVCTCTSFCDQYTPSIGDIVYISILPNTDPSHLPQTTCIYQSITPSYGGNPYWSIQSFDLQAVDPNACNKSGNIPITGTITFVCNNDSSRTITITVPNGTSGTINNPCTCVAAPTCDPQPPLDFSVDYDCDPVTGDITIYSADLYAYSFTPGGSSLVLIPSNFNVVSYQSGDGIMYHEIEFTVTADAVVASSSGDCTIQAGVTAYYFTECYFD